MSNPETNEQALKPTDVVEPSLAAQFATILAIYGSGAIGGVLSGVPGAKLMSKLIPTQQGGYFVEKLIEASGTGVVAGMGVATGVTVSIFALDKLFGDKALGTFVPGPDY